MDAQELTKKVLETTAYSSTYKIAKACGTSHVSVWQWAHGETQPKFEHALVLAELAGLPDPIKVAASIRVSGKVTREVRAALRRVMQTAACLALLAGSYHNTDANASADNHFFAESGQTVYYVKLWMVLAALGMLRACRIARQPEYQSNEAHTLRLAI